MAEREAREKPERSQREDREKTERRQREGMGVRGKVGAYGKREVRVKTRIATSVYQQKKNTHTHTHRHKNKKKNE
jgi:hypothetical protein